jgi:ABC-type spermidine/putrescine transport system permease subunit II
LKIAACTTLLATVLGTLLAFSLVRGQLPGARMGEPGERDAADRADDHLFGRVYGLFSSLRLIGDWRGIVLGHTVHAIPVRGRHHDAALRTFDIALENARWAWARAASAQSGG